MNNSDLPGAPEEKWTAYFDSRLEAAEVAAFEREHPDAAGEKAAVSKLGQTLRMHSQAPVLRNPDFFNAAILREILPRQHHSGNAPARPPFWSLWRMALAGACCLAAAGAIYAVFVNGNDQRRDAYVANVLWAKAGDRQLSATVFDADGLAVVWIGGLEPLPNDYELQ